MAITIDTCGLSCPQPVLMFLTALKKDDNNEFDVLVDNDASRENVTRAAKNHGFTVDLENDSEDVVRLKIRK